MPRNVGFKKRQITASSRAGATKTFRGRYPNRVIKNIRLVTKVWEITHTPR